MIQLRIPATTANLGPGFDCMGLALDLWNTFELRLVGPPGRVLVTSYGEGADTLPTDESNLIVQIMKSELGKRWEKLKAGISITCHNGIPVMSGLGSSSTAVLAGVGFAEALGSADNADGFDPDSLDLDQVLQRAFEIEGHGDNVGPAVRGGLMLIMASDLGLILRQVPFTPFRVVVCVPEYAYPTSRARERLPKEVPHSDAVFNVGRAMFVLQALRDGDDDLLRRAMEDRLHEPYRLPDIPGARAAKRAARQNGAIAVSLSGAGPGMLAFTHGDHAAIGQAMQQAFAAEGLSSRWWALDAITRGIEVRRLP